MFKKNSFIPVSAVHSLSAKSVLAILTLCLVHGIKSVAQEPPISPIEELKSVVQALDLRLNNVSVSRYFQKPEQVRHIFSTALQRPNYRGSYSLQIDTDGRISVYFSGGSMPDGRKAQPGSYRRGRWSDSLDRVNDHEAQFRIELFISNVFGLEPPARPVWGRMTSQHPGVVFVNDDKLYKNDAEESDRLETKWVRLDDLPENTETLYVTVNNSLDNLPQMLAKSDRIRNLEFEIYPKSDSVRPLDFQCLRTFNSVDKFHFESSLKLTRSEMSELFAALPPSKRVSILDPIPVKTGNGPSELIPLAKNQQLGELVVGGALNDEDITAISKADKLSKLAVKLSDDAHVTGFEWLSELKQLQSLTLASEDSLSSDRFNRLVDSLGPSVEKLFLFMDLEPHDPKTGASPFENLCRKKSVRSVSLQGAARWEDVRLLIANSGFESVLFQGRETARSDDEYDVSDQADKKPSVPVAKSPLLLKWQMEFGIHSVKSLKGTLNEERALTAIDELVSARRNAIGSQDQINMKLETIRELTQAIAELQAELKLMNSRPRSASPFSNPIARAANDAGNGMYRLKLEDNVNQYIEYRDSLQQEVRTMEQQIKQNPVTRKSVVDASAPKTSFRLPSSNLSQEQLAYEIATLSVQVNKAVSDSNEALIEIRKIVALDGRANLYGLRLNQKIEQSADQMVDIISPVSLELDQDTDIVCLRKSGVFSLRKSVRLDDPNEETRRLIQVVVCVRPDQ